jgi:hypothetical protein
MLQSLYIVLSVPFTQRRRQENMTGGPRYILGGLSESHNTNIYIYIAGPLAGGARFFQGGQAPLAPPMAPTLHLLNLNCPSVTSGLKISNGMVLFGMVHFGMVLFGMVRCSRELRGRDVPIREF